jgi:uncharacterized protein YciI
VIDQYLADHRNFLDEGYKNNYFIVSGPRHPRTGGIILSQLKEREQLENILKQDPYAIHHLAEYEIIEFNPVKYHTNFTSFI